MNAIVIATRHSSHAEFATAALRAGKHRVRVEAAGPGPGRAAVGMRSGSVPVLPVVPFVDLARQHAPLRDVLRAAFDRVLASGAFTLGEEVAHFEEEFAAYCGVKHCIGMASGTSALTVGIQAAGVEPGDEVIVPAHTFIASALAVLHAGATPVFADVEEGTGLIDLASAEEVITDRVAAILPVHLYGQVCDMGAIDRFAKRHGIAVLEDAAQAHGATRDDRVAGSFGTAAAFSFYPTKNLGALGDGGAITTNNDDLAKRARMLRDLGQRVKGDHAVAGWCERLDGLQAALLRVKLPHLDRWNESRREVAAAYRIELADRVRLLEEAEEGCCVYHLFPIRVRDRDDLVSRLADAGVQTGVHYSPSLPDQPPFAGTRGPVAGCPVAARWAREEVSLPMFHGLRPAEAEWVGEACSNGVTVG